MNRETEEPTIVTTPNNPLGEEEETHPAYALIGANRVSYGGGAVLFDSDVQHQHTVRIRIKPAKRKRNLKSDWIFASGRAEYIEVELSEAQWASFVSTMNVGDGVPCTLRERDGLPVPEFPYRPRLAMSMKETRQAAHEAYDHILADLDAYEKLEADKAAGTKVKREALHRLRSTIRNARPNVEFAGKMLIEQTENVVQKARSDIEAFVYHKAAQLGLAPAELNSLPAASLDILALTDGEAIDAEVVEDRLQHTPDETGACCCEPHTEGLPLKACPSCPAHGDGAIGEGTF